MLLAVCGEGLRWLLMILVRLRIINVVFPEAGPMDPRISQRRLLSSGSPGVLPLVGQLLWPEGTVIEP